MFQLKIVYLTYQRHSYQSVCTLGFLIYLCDYYVIQYYDFKQYINIPKFIHQKQSNANYINLTSLILFRFVKII